MGQSKNDDDSLVKLEIGKGWKKQVSKLNSHQLAIVILAIVFCYFLVEFMKNVLESRLQYNSTLFVPVIVIVLLVILAIFIFTIDYFSEDKSSNG